MIRTFFLLFVLLNLDGGTYRFRDINKPVIKLDEEIKIIQAGQMRAGSTLVFNVLKYLFEDRVSTNKYFNLAVPSKNRVLKHYTFTEREYNDL